MLGGKPTDSLPTSLPEIEKEKMVGQKLERKIRKVNSIPEIEPITSIPQTNTGRRDPPVPISTCKEQKRTER